MLFSNININDYSDILILINGAAFVIQRAWKSHKLRQKSITNLETSYQKPTFISSNKNNFLPDVMLVVEKKIFHCHSVVLWSNSEFLKEQIDTYNDYDTIEDNQYKYKFELFISLKCWELICDFIYGNQIKIHKKVF